MITGSDKCGTTMKLCPVSFGLALGITSGLFLMFFAWAAAIWGVGGSVMDMYVSFYYGYGPTFLGGIIGGIWGLVVGFIFGAIIALLYDCIVCCCKSKSCCAKKDEDNQMGQL